MQRLVPMSEATYIHGTDPEEQERLALLNRLTNPPFLDFLELQAADRVLEVGSGLGILAAEVARRVPNGMVTGVEFSADQLARAERSVANLRFVLADAHHLPFEDGAFDKVYCRYLLEHVADPLRVLGEMRRVLRSGGLAFAQENNILVNVLDPECPQFDAVWRQFAVLQRQLGGDALIGKRLFALFRQADFEQVRLSLQPEVHTAHDSTFRPWIRNTIGNVRSGAGELRRRALASDEEIRSAVAELEAFADLPDASAIFYWNRVKAVKGRKGA